MSALKKAFASLSHRSKDARSPDGLSPAVSSRDASTDSERAFLDDEGKPMSRNQSRRRNKRDQQEERKRASESRDRELENHRREEEERAAREEPEELHARYGTLPVNQSAEWPQERRDSIDSMPSRADGDQVIFRARVHTKRPMSARLVFVLFRQQASSIQGVVEEKEGVVSNHFVRWAQHIPTESIVLVRGTIRRPEERIERPTIHEIEIVVESLHIISKLTKALPFRTYEAETVHEKLNDGVSSIQKINDRTRLSNRVLDLRTPTSQAIFRVNSAICNIFRTHLNSQGFIEIHTPKLQGGATESGSSVFQLDYFGRPAFLAQSPQLAKQMAISADFERVYEIGPVFRAENSNTHRHLTEYIGLDLEMTFEEHYHEALDVIDGMFKQVFKGIYESYRRELETIKVHFPHDDLLWLDETPRLPFREGIAMLKDSGWTHEDGSLPSEEEDLSTRDEIRLGKLVREKYKTDFYILDKFPASARPFYTMPDPENPKVTNSFDIFIRGQEILSGGQRVHNAKMLEDQMAKLGLDTGGMEEYIEAFRLGAPPHAGGGIGLERVVMLLLNLGNIRLASLFHRDPRSLPGNPIANQLRHPESSTLHPPWRDTKRTAEKKELQPLGKLIANYGDASNTSWLDDRYKVWRHSDTGAAIGYVPSGEHAIMIGDPLCDKSQHGKIISNFLEFLKRETHLKPIWLLVGREVEEVLGAKNRWRTLTCIAESRVDTGQIHPQSEQEVGRKIRHAKKEGVKIKDVPVSDKVPEDIQAQCDERMEDWRNNRHGTQVHLTELNPWRDMEHRRYFYALDASDKVCALVVLAQLSRENGYQVKYSLDFPDAPHGTIEAITVHAIQAANQAGIKSLTFGASATQHLTPMHHMHGVRVHALASTYRSIVTQLKLTDKSDFRRKLGAVEDPVYICYPKGGMGPRGIRAVMNFFEAE
ncbi:MAG: hypothetical protein M1833_002433, partial [Piccolia ochrophora]